ncbi:polysaccharide deacetylase family protein [Peterkaempfera bronchialis]|uniref:Polysaccharide deacetylase family protein n=1 Tax=Peterkaempfera bronchialis TaxID=2126346 RepID=A0A345SSE5_9ACTN|nr:polysaccharide deacetylase family protein [Peterkaempfera bronchialis]
MITTFAPAPGRHPVPVTDRRRRRLDALLRHSPAQPVFRARAARRLSVLAYHEIDDPTAFAAQMDRLLRLARPVSLDEVQRASVEDRPLPPRSVLVTFDDGDRSVVTEGLPVLARRSIPAVAFVVAGLVGGDQPFWWREAHFLARHGGTARSLPPGGAPEAVVRRMKALPDPDRRRSLAEMRVSATRRAPRQAQLSPEDLHTLRGSGVRIGNHTLGHPCLDHCDEPTVRTEIVDAHRSLERWLGEPPTAFAYPNGNFDSRADGVLRELGYRLGFLFDHRHEALLPRNPLRISRLRVNASTSLHRFDTILSGLHPAVHRLRGGT